MSKIKETILGATPRETCIQDKRPSRVFPTGVYNSIQTRQ